MRLFMLRHGETEWNSEGRFQGRMDIPLNQKGRRQAELAAEALASVKLHSIWSSDLSRAGETAWIIGKNHGSEIKIERELTEIDHGEWEGRNCEEIERKWPGMLEKWHSSPHTVTMPGGENLYNVRERVIKGFNFIGQNSSNNAVVVCHDAVLKVLLCYLLGCSLENFWKFQIENCSITIVEVTFEGIRVPLMGGTSHLGYLFQRKEQKGL